MATAKKTTAKRTAAKKSAEKTARGVTQDRKRVAAGQDYEVKLVAKETHRSAKAVKKAIKKVGNARAKVKKTVRGR